MDPVGTVGWSASRHPSDGRSTIRGSRHSRYRGAWLLWDRIVGNQIEAMEAKGGVGALLEKHKLPLISAYCNTNLSAPDQRKESMAKTLEWAKLVKKILGGHFDLALSILAIR